MELDKLKQQRFAEQLLEIKAFKRFPWFIPYVPKDYDNGYKKLLLVWESYYHTKGEGELYEKAREWYDLDKKDESNKEMLALWEKEKNNYWKKHWNFKCKIDKNGYDKKGSTFLNPERVLKEISGSGDPYGFCAGYNYFLRPAPPKEKKKRYEFKREDADEKYAFDAFCEIVRVIKPEFIVFFSKKARESFEKMLEKNNKNINVPIKNLKHPSSSWWYRKNCPQELKTFLSNWKKQ